MGEPKDMDQRHWNQMCRETPLLAKLSDEDYRKLFCQWKHGKNQEVLGYLTCLCLDEIGETRDTLSEHLYDKVVKAIRHKLRFGSEDLKDLVHLRPDDHQVTSRLIENDNWLKDSGVSQEDGLLMEPSENWLKRIAAAKQPFEPQNTPDQRYHLNGCE